MSPGIAIGLVVVLFVSLFAGAWAWRRASSPHPETLRKTVHVGMGLIALPFPWLFRDPTPVFLLGVFSLCVLLFLRLRGNRGSEFGTILQGVGRRSMGDLYFPISICVLFALAHTSPCLYVVPVLVLTVADTVAALIGIRYGAHVLMTAEGRKSAEGSLGFCVTAFLATWIALLVFGVAGVARSLLIGLNLGLIVMSLEAIALRGRDNLYTPLGAYALLSVYLNLDLGALALRLLLLIGLMLVLYFWRIYTALDDVALLGGALAGYAAGAIGGWRWLVPPAIFLLTYTWVFPNPYGAKRGAHNIYAVISITSAGLLWLLLLARYEEQAFYFCYTVAWAAQLSMVGVASLACRYPNARPAALIARAVVSAFLLVCLPYMLLSGLTLQVLRQLAFALALTAASSVGFYFLQPQIRDCPVDGPRWLRQGSLGAVASLMGLLLAF